MAAAAAVGFSTSATAWRMPSISERAAALLATVRDAVGDEDQPLVGCELARGSSTRCTGESPGGLRNQFKMT
jgi:hypothetical protein